MDIEFDPAKDAINVAKHGVSLALAARIDWSDYGELREIGFAVVDNRLYVVVFVQRGETMRVVSLRKANAREVKDYDEAL